MPTVQQKRAGDGVSVAASFERLMASGQQLIEHRLDLLRLDTRLRVLMSARGAGAIAVGALVLLLGWVAVMIAVVAWLRPLLGLEVGLVIVGGVHLLAGGAVLAWGLHALRDHPGEN